MRLLTGRGSLVALLALAIVSAFAAGTALAAPAPAVATYPGPPPVRVEARAIDRHADGSVTARGSVLLTRGTDTLRADTATYSPATGEILASGKVVLTRPEGEMRAESLRYNTLTRAASALQSRTAIPAPGRPDVTYYAKAGSLSGSRTEYRLVHGLFTTCGFEHPHWAIVAREIVVRPGDRVVARGIGLDLFGTRLFTVPRLSFGLGKGQEAPLIPRLVGGRRDFLGVRGDFRFGLHGNIPGEGYVVLSARHTIRTGVGIDRIGSVPVGLRAGYKEDATSRFISGMTVTVIPAVSFFLPESVGPRKGPLQIGLLRAPNAVQMMGGEISGGAWEPGRRFRFVAAGSAARFIEHPTSTIANRLNVAAAVEASPVRLLPHLRLAGAVRGRYAAYTHAQPYRIFSPELGVEWQPSRADTLGLVWRSYEVGGQTPFFFDRIDSPRALRFTWDNRTTQHGLNAEVDYDLTHGDIYGWQVGYSQRLHCLQPGLVIRRNGEDTNFGVTLEIPGIGGGI